MDHEWEREKFKYFQNFKIKNYVSKGSKNLMIVEFTDRSNSDFPNIALLKEFRSVRPRFENEAKMLEKWSALHPNILKPYYFTEIDGKFRIFIEYCECGSISKIINERKNNNYPWSDSQLINHFITIADVVNSLHEKDYVHRAIKPDNIFVKENEVLKIGDFGDTKEIHIGESKFETLGTLLYMSPRLKNMWSIIKPDKSGKKLILLLDSKKEEVWSVGKTFYEMATLNLAISLPDEEDEIIDMMISDMKSRPRRLINLLIWMLKDNYIDRPNMKEVLEILHKIKDEITETHSDSQIILKDSFSSLEKYFAESNGSSNTVSYEEKRSSKDRAIYREWNWNQYESNLYGFDSWKTKYSFEEKDCALRSCDDINVHEFRLDYDKDYRKTKYSSEEKNCTLCSCDNIYVHECGLEYDKDYIVNYIATSIKISASFEEIKCLNCSNPFPKEFYICEKNHFSL